MRNGNSGSCCGGPAPKPQQASPNTAPKQWQRNYILVVAMLVLLWWLAYSYILPFSGWLVFDVLGMAQGAHIGVALEFFMAQFALTFMQRLAGTPEDERNCGCAIA